MKMKSYPCLKNLKSFEKTGCPRKNYENGEGCPYWLIGDVPDKGGTKTIGMCGELWKIQYQQEMLRLLEGNQGAIESLRNGLIVEFEDGSTQPKPDPSNVMTQEIMTRIEKTQMALVQIAHPDLDVKQLTEGDKDVG